ncbi:hypothetical protein TNCV_5041281 [Trichonephila clavipes]|nr:hypothetical protein TNCV_5041281 [Trichonephila clavipes]
MRSAANNPRISALRHDIKKQSLTKINESLAWKLHARAIGSRPLVELSRLPQGRRAPQFEKRWPDRLQRPPLRGGLQLTTRQPRVRYLDH